MQRSKAAVASAGFFVVAPGTVVGVIPWLITRWRFSQPLPGWAAPRVVGAVLIAAGLIPPISAFTEFVKAGGTPMPIAPTEQLVVSGFNWMCGFYVCRSAWRHHRTGTAVRQRPATNLRGRGVGGARGVRALGTKNRLSPANSAPSTTSTGAPCRPGCPGCAHGQRAGDARAGTGGPPG